MKITSNAAMQMDMAFAARRRELFHGFTEAWKYRDNFQSKEQGEQLLKFWSDALESVNDAQIEVEGGLR